MWVEEYQWHYDYVRLAWDTGFAFEKCKFPNLDKNKICVVDIDRIVKERDVASVDRYIPTVVQYILDDDQAKVLDINFVKMFRISQLAVEYLLFCKKYLDNTVVLLKKELAKNREEIKELKLFSNDLEGHITSLTKQQAISTFKCSICGKLFSSEEFLKSHFKRRHSTQLFDNSTKSETDKLNSEIKELKEKLNYTEKLLKERDKDQHNEVRSIENDNNGSKMIELVEKFEKFREHICSKLKELHIQKSFYEENFGKLFDIVISNKENMDPKPDNQISASRIENTTQTDKVLHIESVQNKNVFDYQESTPSFNERESKGSPDLAEVKESLEAKISTTLAGIEGQMQAFWNKLSEMEQNKTSIVPHIERTNDCLDDEVKLAQPKIRPRSKLSQPTSNTRRSSDNAENIKLELDKLMRQENQQIRNEISTPPLQIHKKQLGNSIKAVTSRTTNVIPKSMVKEVSDIEFETNSGSNDSVSESESVKISPKEGVLVKPSASTFGNRSVTSLKKISLNKEIIDTLSKEIECVVESRLQELGISASWTSIPQKSFDKALEIITHQAELTKKTYPNFIKLRKNIEKDVGKKVSNKNKIVSSPLKNKIQNVVKIAYRPKSGRKSAETTILSPKRDSIEIKNRALYETDTESEHNFNQTYIKSTNSSSDPYQIYSNVVKELQTLPRKSPKDQDSDLDDFDQKEDPQNIGRSVLKSFPSVGSLSKKKVLFDLDSESSKVKDAPVIPKADGSTTSVASSIFGEKRDIDEETKDEGEAKDKKNKDVADLLDFDFSDL